MRHESPSKILYRKTVTLINKKSQQTAGTFNTEDKAQTVTSPISFQSIILYMTILKIIGQLFGIVFKYQTGKPLRCTLSGRKQW